MRERECVLHPVTEQVAIGKQREGVMEGELPQLLFERLTLADVAEIEGESLHRRILGEVTADALQHAAPATPLEAQLERADSARGRCGQFAEEPTQLLGIVARPEIRKALTEDELRLQSERALGCG